MAKYINLDHLIRFIKENGYVYANILENWPTVDVVEVVRCKDCVHYELGACLKIYDDGNVSKESWQSRKSNDFCSYGERREEDVESKWHEYLEYLIHWAISHSDKGFAGCCPVCYDEWLDSERSDEE